MESISIKSFNCSEIIRFLEQRKEKPFPLQRSTCGASGFTFLPLSKEFPWVIKWQNRVQAEAEHLCTQLFRRTFPQSSIPMTELPHQESDCAQIRHYFEHTRRVFSYHKPLFMEYLEGCNLMKFAEYGHLFKLTSDQHYVLGKAFGKAAGYDFLIANTDRFLPASFDGEILDDYCINSGNILIEMDRHDLRHIHLIDNAPHFSHFFTAEEQDEMSGNEVYCSMYSGESSFEASSSITTEDGVGKRERLTDRFLAFMKADTGLLEKMAQQIVVGIMNDLSLPSEKHFKAEYLKLTMDTNRMESLKKGLIVGLQQSQEDLQSAPLLENLKALENEIHCCEEMTEILLDFLKTNIIAIQTEKAPC